MDDQIEHKVCTRCKIKKPFYEFWKHEETQPLGRHSQCKLCSRISRRELKIKKGWIPKSKRKILDHPPNGVS